MAVQQADVTGKFWKALAKLQTTAAALVVRAVKTISRAVIRAVGAGASGMAVEVVALVFAAAGNEP